MSGHGFLIISHVGTTPSEVQPISAKIRRVIELTGHFLLLGKEGVKAERVRGILRRGST